MSDSEFKLAMHFVHTTDEKLDAVISIIGKLMEIHISNGELERGNALVSDIEQLMAHLEKAATARQEFRRRFPL